VALGDGRGAGATADGETRDEVCDDEGEKRGERDFIGATPFEALFVATAFVDD
jgi:hypothetical protein